jgi:hypothetical protein
MRRGNEGKGLGQMLGALSIGLGVLDLVAAPRIARFLGMRGSEGFIRACGFREVVSGMGLVGARNRTPWIWSRVGGDALDAAALITRLKGRNRQKRNVKLMLAAVGAMTALDLLYARSLKRAKAARLPQDRRNLDTARAAEGDMEILYGAATPVPSRSLRRAKRRQRRELKAAA